MASERLTAEREADIRAVVASGLDALRGETDRATWLRGRGLRSPRRGVAGS